MRENSRSLGWGPLMCRRWRERAESCFSCLSGLLVSSWSFLVLLSSLGLAGNPSWDGHALVARASLQAKRAGLGISSGMVRVDGRSEGGSEGCRLEIEAVVGLKLAMVDREVVDVEMRVEAGEGTQFTFSVLLHDDTLLPQVTAPDSLLHKRGVYVIYRFALVIPLHIPHWLLLPPFSQGKWILL